MWQDQETDTDLVNYGGIAATITALIDDGILSPLTVGVHGDWGSGKSSILSMVRRTLGDRDDIGVLSFNGWLFQGFEDAKITIMDSIINELQRHKRFGPRIKDAARDLLRRIDWLKAAKKAASIGLAIHTVGASLVVENALDSLSDESGSGDKLLRDPDDSDVTARIHEFRAAFRKLLEDAGVRRLVVIVDDLDRCLPSTAIDTLEALRLSLFVDRTVFIVAADEAMIEYAVREHFPGLPYSEGPAPFTKNYLEKLIQIPFRLPPMSAEEARSYVALLFAEAALRPHQGAIAKVLEAVRVDREHPWEPKHVDVHFIEKVLGDSVKLDQSAREHLLIADRVSAPLARGTRGNPRQIKRFLNTLMLRMRLADAYDIKGRINAGVLAKLMLLERLQPHLYRAVLELARASENGKVAGIDLTTIEAPASPKQLNVKTKKSDPDGGMPQVDALPDILSKSAAYYEWSQLEPKLSGVDLRAYLFVSREQTPGFVGSAEFLDLPPEVVRKFLSGNEIEVAGLRTELKALPVDKAELLLDQGLTELRTLANLKHRAPVMIGLGALVQVHPVLQKRFLEAISDFTSDRLGPWIAFYLRGTFTDATVAPALRLLQDRLKAEGDDPMREALAIAAQGGKG